MKLLLDSHIRRTVAEQLRHHGVDVEHLAEWKNGGYLNEVDARVLAAAFDERRVLITYDCRTISPLLVEWARSGEHHAGVVLVDERTVRSNDVGRLLRAILWLVQQSGERSWEDQVLYLSPA